MRLVILALLGAALVACSPASSSRIDPRHFSALPLTFEFPKVHRDHLSNGLQIYQFSDSELPLIEVSVMIGSGSIADPSDKTGLGALFATTLRTGGAGRFGPEEFDQILERYAINLGISSSTWTTQLSLSCRSEDLALAIELLADLLRRPHFAVDRFEIARNQAIEGVRRQNDNPASIARRTVAKALYPDHAFGRHASLASLRAIKRADLIAFSQAVLHPDNLRIGISGDFSPGQVRQLLTQSFADWQAAGGKAQEVVALPDPLPPAIWISDRQLPQTTILMSEIGISKDNPDLHSLKVMNYILGGGGFNSRLMREIRSNRGLAYSVYSYFQVGRRLPGSFLAAAETKNSSVVEVLTIMQEQMRRIQAEPVGTAELNQAKESLINSFVFAFEDPHEVVDRQMRMDFFDYPEDYLQTYRRKLGAVTAADVQRVAQTYLHPDRQAWVLVGRKKDFSQGLATFSRVLQTVPVEVAD